MKHKIGPFLIRKTKEECLDSLPILHRSKVKIAVSEKNKLAYINLVECMKGNIKNNRKFVNKQGFVNLEILAQIRQLVSRSKVFGTTELVKAKLKEKPDNPIIIFVCFLETSHTLKALLEEPSVESSLPKTQEVISLLDDSNDIEVHENLCIYDEDGGLNSMNNTNRIRCNCLTGDIIKQQDRSKIVNDFQKGNIDVLICTYGVASTGITLTKSSTVILLDRPWTYADVSQAEDRVRRIGQKAEKIESLWISSGLSYDDKVDKMLNTKFCNGEKVLESNYAASLVNELLK